MQNILLLVVSLPCIHCGRHVFREECHRNAYAVRPSLCVGIPTQINSLTQGHCEGRPNLVPRACDPWEGNEGSGIIRCRKPGILAKIELRIHFNGQSDSSLKRIIPEPSFPSQGSQARGTRLGPPELGPGDEDVHNLVPRASALIALRSPHPRPQAQARRPSQWPWVRLLSS